MVEKSEREGRAYAVRGRVQGVGFRWWTCSQARELGVVGTVRNASDGSVRVRAAGSGELLDRFEVLLRRGPPGARVDSLEIMELGTDAGDGEGDVISASEFAITR